MRFDIEPYDPEQYAHLSIPSDDIARRLDALREYVDEILHPDSYLNQRIDGVVTRTTGPVITIAMMAGWLEILSIARLLRIAFDQDERLKIDGRLCTGFHENNLWSRIHTHKWLLSKKSRMEPFEEVLRTGRYTKQSLQALVDEATT